MSKETKELKTTEDKEDSVTTVEDFTPTPRMKLFVATAVECHETSFEKIAMKSSDIHPKSVYRWLRTPGFREWFAEEYTIQFRKQHWKLMSVGMKKALDGDIEFFKVMVESYEKIMGQAVGGIDNIPPLGAQPNLQQTNIYLDGNKYIVPANQNAEETIVDAE